MTPEQEAELKRMKAWLPYRIVFGVLLPDGTFEVHANYNRRKMNDFLRKGYQVWEVK